MPQVLVSGANGYIGSHVANELLSAKYRVRGTVRSTSKQAWLQRLFDEKYGEGQFELVQVEDASKPGASIRIQVHHMLLTKKETGAFNEAIKGAHNEESLYKLLAI